MFLASAVHRLLRPRKEVRAQLLNTFVELLQARFHLRSIVWRQLVLLLVNREETHINHRRVKLPVQ
eukprot:3354290-Pyramimonas_sp.AAC.1